MDKCITIDNLDYLYMEQLFQVYCSCCDCCGCCEGSTDDIIGGRSILVIATKVYSIHPKTYSKHT